MNYSLPFTSPGGTVKPVPSYEKLKEETEFLELRVREFYKGKCVLAEEAVTCAQAEEHPSKDKVSVQRKSVGAVRSLPSENWNQLFVSVSPSGEGKGKSRLAAHCMLGQIKQASVHYVIAGWFLFSVQRYEFSYV